MQKVGPAFESIFAKESEITGLPSLAELQSSFVNEEHGRMIVAEVAGVTVLQ